MIRHATPADLDAMVEMGALFHAYSGLSEIGYDPQSFRATLEAGLDSDTQAYFVAERDGKLTGMTGGIVYPAYFNNKQIAGQELFWWGEGEGRGLYRALEQWAKSKGCASFAMVALDNEQAARMGRIYARMGYRPVEHHYIKRL